MTLNRKAAGACGIARFGPRMAATTVIPRNGTTKRSIGRSLTRTNKAASATTTTRPTAAAGLRIARIAPITVSAAAPASSGHRGSLGARLPD